MSIEELDELRKKVRNLEIIAGVVSIILLVVISLVAGNFGYGIIAGIFSLVIISLFNSKNNNKFVKEYKDMFVLKSLKNVFTDLTYEPDRGIESTIIKDTNMMYMGDRYSSNDFVSGKYKNINYMGADVHIEKEETYTDNDGHTHTTYVTIFRGKWMVFDFNKTFKANIEVCQKHFGNNKVNTLFGKERFKKVSMEDEVFNKNFKVYAQNEEEAFYILTPSLMEKIKNISSELKGKILLCFVDNKLHIGLYDNKDSFEPNVFKKIEEERIINEVEKDIKLITNFVDKLNLDNDLFKKGGK